MQKFWFFLYSLIILLSFVVAVSIPLNGDEGLYSIAIKDVQKYGPLPYATYFGEPMFWKPPLMFTIYALISKPLLGIFAQEIAFRIPSLLLIIASLVIMYLLVRDDLGREKTHYALLLFLLSVPVFAFGYKVLTDTLTFFFIMCALYATKKYAETTKNKFIAVHLSCILLAGFTKSHLATFLGIALTYTYLVLSKKKILNPQLIASSTIAIVLLFSYPLLLGKYSTDYYHMYFGDSVRIGPEHILRDSFYFFVQTAPLGIIAVILSIASVIKDRKITFYGIWVLLSLLPLFSKTSMLPWYFIYFIPAFAVVIASNIQDNPIDKLMLALLATALLLFSLYFATLVPLTNFKDIGEILSYIEENKNSSILVVSRCGESIANRIYDVDRGVIVTPENNMQIITNNAANTVEFVGIKREVLNEENIRGLIYNYDDEKLLPKFIDQFGQDERYIPPIGRTRKNWEGGFEVIIVQNDYVEMVRKVATDYTEVYRTENGEFYAFRKLGQ